MLPTDEILKCQPILELIALELAYARMRANEVSPAHLETFERAIEKRQADSNILPIKQKAVDLRVTVNFHYRNRHESNADPAEDIKYTLEWKSWQRPEMLTNILDASRRREARDGMGVVNVTRILRGGGLVGSEASSYGDPDYKVE